MPRRAGLEVLEGLDQLGLGVHHEGAVRGHGLADRLTTEDVDVERAVAGVLPVVGSDRRRSDPPPKTASCPHDSGRRSAPTEPRPESP